jgi:hypothetical protein
MDCRTFEKHQLGFVDGTLPDTLVVEMQLHLSECEPCSRRDTAFRRGLLVLRNLPEIQPSADFAERLALRLRVSNTPTVPPGTWLRPPGMGAVAAAAVGVLAAGYLAVFSFGTAGTYEPVLAPVIATQPERSLPQLFDHVVVMPAAAGFPMWSSALMVEQAPMQLMNAELQMANWFWDDR